ncbi:MAG: GAK system ATP-grasp enzyme [Pseudomonadota bacterium]
MKQVAVIGVPGGWSSEQLADRLGELTGFRALVDLAQVRLDLSRGKAFFHDLELTALDGLAVKKVGHSYSPKLLDRLEFLRFIAAAGVRVFSAPDNIFRVLNRLSCTIGLVGAGIPIPPTVVTENPEEAARAVRNFGRAVLKPLYTSKARGMVVIEDSPAMREEIENYKDSGNSVLYVQKLIELPGWDLGIVFLGGKYLATYARVGQKGAWNTTTANGGYYQPYEPSPGLIELADRAQKIFNLDFTCVDVAETDRGPVVFEVSAFGGFRGLKEGCGIEADKAYAEYILRELTT